MFEGMAVQCVVVMCEDVEEGGVLLLLLQEVFDQFEVLENMDEIVDLVIGEVVDFDEIDVVEGFQVGLVSVCCFLLIDSLIVLLMI